MILAQRLQRYQRSKLEFERNICQHSRPWAHQFEPGWVGRYFFDPQLWPLKALQPLDQNQWLVPHSKDLFHIYFERKAHSYWVSFKVCNLGSKWTYFDRAYVVWVCNFFVTAVGRINQLIQKAEIFCCKRIPEGYQSKPLLYQWLDWNIFLKYIVL